MFIRQQKLTTCLLMLIITLSGFWSSSVYAGYASQQHVDTSSSSIGAGTYSAGFIGNYAGHLTGGQAVSELLHEKASHHGEEQLESHDFSDDHSAAALHESLGSLGDHLDEHNFPTDVEGAAHYKSDYGATATDYAEAASASEHHAEVESLGHEHHYNEVEHLGQYEQHHFEDSSSGLESYGHGDFESKPVPGIDHGKGAFSYSSLYESKDHEYAQ